MAVCMTALLYMVSISAAFFPQFIQTGLPALPQFGILRFMFMRIDISWYLIDMLSGHKLSCHVKKARVLQTFNWVMAVCLWGLPL
jgi:threonine/homoserine/homoserine lactone efflux protein